MDDAVRAGLGVSSSLSITACCTEKPGSILLVFTFVNKVLGLQVESFPVTLPPKPGDGGVELPAAVRLHGRRRGQKVPLLPAEGTSIWAQTFPLQARWTHLQGEVVVGNVDVARVVALVGIVLAPLPVSPRVGLVPVIGADRHGEQPQRTKRQEEPCAGEDFHRGHLPHSMESPNSRSKAPPWPWCWYRVK